MAAFERNPRASNKPGRERSPVLQRSERGVALEFANEMGLIRVAAVVADLGRCLPGCGEQLSGAVDPGVGEQGSEAAVLQRQFALQAARGHVHVAGEGADAPGACRVL